MYKIEEIIEKVDGVSMEPLVKDWVSLKLLKNYYQCEWKLERWDLVYFDSIITHWAVIKKLSVLPGDIVKFENGNMFLNWEILSNSIWEKYIFSDQEIQKISWYTPNWTLQEWAFLIFWDNINSNQSRDSRAFGPVSSEYFLWKVKK